LGAGGRSVRLNGKVYETLAARVGRRPACDLYHSALEVRVGGTHFVIEMAPAWGVPASDRGVVVEGSVGASWAGRFRFFRYEIRRWRNGFIPDKDAAVESPVRLSDDHYRAAKLLSLVPFVPAAVWGRDQMTAGEMWNSNSVISWLIARSGINLGAIRPPTRGRAPGWQAGVVVAGRERGGAGDGFAEFSARKRGLRAPTDLQLS
jgi:hypothetical protein